MRTVRIMSSLIITSKIMPLKIGFPVVTYQQLLRPQVLSVRRFCKSKMSQVTQRLFPKFIPVVEKEEENGSASTTTDDNASGLKFRVVSYNILAQVFVKSSYFPHSPSPCLKWKARSQAVLSTLKSLEADFLCIQELDEYDNFYKGNIERHGYSSIYIQRSGQKRDGCGIFYKSKCAELVLKETIEYNDLVDQVQDGNTSSVHMSDDVPVDENTQKKDSPRKKGLGGHGDPNDPRVRLKRDCVGIMGAFKIKDLHQHLIVVANTHIYWDPEWADVKLAQVKYLLSRLAQFKASVSNKYSCTTSVIVCGDFNSTPGDKVYKYLVSGNSAVIPPKENLEELPIPLCSVYASIGGEPPFTNCTPDFTDTLDYIFFSPSGHLKPISFLELPGPESADVIGGLPNYHHPSDHLPIGADFEATRNLKLEPDSIATSLNDLKLT